MDTAMLDIQQDRSDTELAWRNMLVGEPRLRELRLRVLDIALRAWRAPGMTKVFCRRHIMQELHSGLMELSDPYTGDHPAMVMEGTFRFFLALPKCHGCGCLMCQLQRESFEPGSPDDQVFGAGAIETDEEGADEDVPGDDDCESS
jgi:hypothetical protein